MSVRISERRDYEPMDPIMDVSAHNNKISTNTKNVIRSNLRSSGALNQSGIIYNAHREKPKYEISSNIKANKIGTQSPKVANRSLNLASRIIKKEKKKEIIFKLNQNNSMTLSNKLKSNLLKNKIKGEIKLKSNKRNQFRTGVRKEDLGSRLLRKNSSKYITPSFRKKIFSSKNIDKNPNTTLKDLSFKKGFLLKKNSIKLSQNLEKKGIQNKFINLKSKMKAFKKEPNSNSHNQILRSSTKIKPFKMGHSKNKIEIFNDPSQSKDNEKRDTEARSTEVGRRTQNEETHLTNANPREENPSVSSMSMSFPENGSLTCGDLPTNDNQNINQKIRDSEMNLINKMSNFKKKEMNKQQKEKLRESNILELPNLEPQDNGNTQMNENNFPSKDNINHQQNQQLYTPKKEQLNPFTRNNSESLMLDLPDLGIKSSEKEKEDQSNLTDREVDIYLNRRKTKYSKEVASYLLAQDNLQSNGPRTSEIRTSQNLRNTDSTEVSRNKLVKNVKMKWVESLGAYSKVTEYENLLVNDFVGRESERRASPSFLQTPKLDKNKQQGVSKKMKNKLKIEIKEPSKLADDNVLSMLTPDNSKNNSSLDGLKKFVNTPKNLTCEPLLVNLQPGLINSISTKNLIKASNFDLKKSYSTYNLQQNSSKSISIKSSKNSKDCRNSAKEAPSLSIFQTHALSKEKKLDKKPFNRRNFDRRVTTYFEEADRFFRPIYEDFGDCPKDLYRLVIFMCEKNCKTDKLFFNNPTNFIEPKMLIDFDSKNPRVKGNNTSTLVEALKCSHSDNFTAVTNKSIYHDMSQVVLKEKTLRPSMYHNLEAFEDDFSFPEDIIPSPKKPQIHHIGEGVEQIDEFTFKIGGIEFKDYRGKSGSKSSTKQVSSSLLPDKNDQRKAPSMKLSKTDYQYKSSTNLHSEEVPVLQSSRSRPDLKNYSNTRYHNVSPNITRESVVLNNTSKLPDISIPLSSNMKYI